MPATVERGADEQNSRVELRPGVDFDAAGNAGWEPPRSDPRSHDRQGRREKRRRQLRCRAQSRPTRPCDAEVAQRLEVCALIAYRPPDDLTRREHTRHQCDQRDEQQRDCLHPGGITDGCETRRDIADIDVLGLAPQRVLYGCFNCSEIRVRFGVHLRLGSVSEDLLAVALGEPRLVR